MSNEILVKQGTEISWASSGGDFALTLTNLSNNSARQGAKADLGAERPRRYVLQLTTGFDDDPDSGGPLEIWWAASASSTAGDGNPGNTTGVDAAYQASLAAINEHTRQLQFVGALIVTDNAASALQRALFVFEPPTRFGMPVVVNKTSEDLSNTAADHELQLIPIIDQIQ